MPLIRRFGSCATTRRKMRQQKILTLCFSELANCTEIVRSGQVKRCNSLRDTMLSSPRVRRRCPELIS